MDIPRLCPARLLSDQHFDMWTPHEFLFPFYDLNSNYYHPWQCSTQNTTERGSLHCDTTKEFGSTVENDKGNYKITLDVHNFRLNEITVKVTDGEIIVEGKHEERADIHGFVMRHFKRRYALPNHCPSENVTSMLSLNGVLIIIAEKKSSGDSEKIVPIKMCVASPRKIHVLSTVNAETTEKECRNETNETIKKTTNQKELQEEHSRLLNPDILKETILSKGNGENTEARITNESMKCSEKNVAGTSRASEGALIKTHLEMSDLEKKMGHQHHSSASSSETSRMKSVYQSMKEESSSYKSSMLTSSIMRARGKSSELINDITAELHEAAENI